MPRRRFSIPAGILFEEAMLVAELVDEHWSPGVGPGLADVCSPRLGPAVAGRLRELVAEARRAVARRSASPAKEHEALRRRAQTSLADLAATLRFAARDPANAPLPEQLVRIRERVRSASALALALDAHAALAEEHLPRLRAIGAFDERWISEARALVPELRAIPARHRQSRAASREVTRARQAIVGEIVDLLNEIRAAARFVFRHEPSIVRQFTSAYARKQQAKSRASRSGTSAPES